MGRRNQAVLVHRSATLCIIVFIDEMSRWAELSRTKDARIPEIRHISQRPHPWYRPSFHSIPPRTTQRMARCELTMCTIAGCNGEDCNISQDLHTVRPPPNSVNQFATAAVPSKQIGRSQLRSVRETYPPPAIPSLWVGSLRLQLPR